MNRVKIAIPMFCCIYVLFVLFIAPIRSVAEESTGTSEEDKNKTNKNPINREEKEKASRTTHTIRINGKTLSYRAVAGDFITQRKMDDGPKGRLFYVAYNLENKKALKRPITFAFNGGPGSSSVWLHLGALGPKRITLADDGSPLPPPVEYGDNPYSWLTFTDLVFVDPIGTGYSRSIPNDEETRKSFYGVQQDIESVGEFIRLYLTRNNRWGSPLFLVGESYGTTRAAGLTRYLHQRYGIDLNGIILISPVLDYDTILFHASNDLPYLLFLPSYVAAAWHHKVLSSSLQQRSLKDLLDEVESFCLNAYTVLLGKGEEITAEERDTLSEKLSAYIGLSDNFIRENNFRVSWNEFVKNILRKKRKLVGRMDTTITGIQTDPSNPYPPYDPSLEPLYGPFSSAMNHYVREDLNYESDKVYEFLNSTVNMSWDWSSGLIADQGFIDVSHTLHDTLAVNKNLKVFIACGYYDLATPYFAAEHTINHMWLAERRSNITLKHYDSGHMIYTHYDELKKLYRDVNDFFSLCLPVS